MALSDDFFNQLRLHNDIMSTMSLYVNLKRAGRDYVCICPFHSEKTPSCHVYTETQSFYCFGCGAGGDVITFIRLIENYEYMEAVRYLAQKSGIPMPEDGDNHTAKARMRILEANREAGKYYHYNLFSDKGANGLKYLKERGLSEHIIKKFGLGYADNDWGQLRSHLKGLGFRDAEMLDAALIVSRNGKVYDKFRDRVMFPIIDRRGNVIAFGGRAISSDAAAKYINTDETLVFKKRSNLYALNYAKNTKEKYLILCEGYMDVVSVYQAGFTNAVATLGTAITPEQARLMKQYSGEVVIAYDSDGAGQAATVKAINLLNEAGVNTRVVKFNDAKDPDEYIKKFGAESFRLQLERADNAIEFELMKLKTGLNMDNPADRSTYMKNAVVLLANIHNHIDRSIYMSYVANEAGVANSIVEQAIEYELKTRNRKNQKNQRRQLIHGNVKRDKINPDASKFPVEAKAERGIISFLYYHPDMIKKVTEKLETDDFPTQWGRKLYSIVLQRLENNQNIDISAISSEFNVDEVGNIMGMLEEFKDLSGNPHILDDFVETLVKYKDSVNSPNIAEMTAEQLLEYTKRKKIKPTGG